nr:uncharacterized protein CTRU02_12255 [Colletotrichum truncatum]KAF6784794.1 hypothetical protein CTRU02_12255 [Colletotrichum truncatum]
MTGAVTASDTESVSKQCEMVVEPNKMVYFDGEGVRKEIHMPKGTARKAAELLEAQNWEELAKFSPWNNQTYTPEDDVRRK